MRLKRASLFSGSASVISPAAKDRDAVLKLVKRAYPDAKPGTTELSCQLNQFSNTIQKGDLLVVPLKTRGTIAIGEIAGPCTTTTEGHPKRPVRWLKSDVPRDVPAGPSLQLRRFHDRLRDQPQRRPQACRGNRQDRRRPWLRERIVALREPLHRRKPTAEEAEVDLDKIARDQIERRVASAFPAMILPGSSRRSLRRKVTWSTSRQPGPDQGIDIVAGRGGLGFEAPRLVVQVKSGNVVADHRPFRR